MLDEIDAEDLPHWWQRWAAEAAGVATLLGVLAIAALVGHFVGPALPWALDALSELAR